MKVVLIYDTPDNEQATVQSKLNISRYNLIIVAYHTLNRRERRKINSTICCVDYGEFNAVGSTSPQNYRIMPREIRALGCSFPEAGAKGVSPAL